MMAAPDTSNDAALARLLAEQESGAATAETSQSVIDLTERLPECEHAGGSPRPAGGLDQRVLERAARTSRARSELRASGGISVAPSAATPALAAVFRRLGSLSSPQGRPATDGPSAGKQEKTDASVDRSASVDEFKSFLTALRRCLGRQSDEALPWAAFLADMVNGSLPQVGGSDRFVDDWDELLSLMLPVGGPVERSALGLSSSSSSAAAAPQIHGVGAPADALLFSEEVLLSESDDTPVMCHHCIDEHPTKETFLMPCGVHRMCHDGVVQFVKMKLKEKRRPACWARGEGNTECGMDIGAEDLLRVQWDDFNDLQQALKELYEIQRDTGVASIANVIHCPTPGCPNAKVLTNPSEREQVYCDDGCGLRFCSLCRNPYHYKVRDCNAVAQISAQFVSWVQSGRREYMQQRADSSEKYAEELAEFSRAEKKNAARNKELLDRYEELRKDEEWKAGHCRCCPHCGRGVEKLEGCDAMICGVDYHGGNDQSGCGQNFNWPSAKPYVARVGNLKREAAPPKPRDMADVSHEPFTCDRCRKVIQGLRFECIHCPSTNFCEVCEGIVEDGDIPPTPNAPAHSTTHTLRIWREPEFTLHDTTQQAHAAADFLPVFDSDDLPPQYPT